MMLRRVALKQASTCCNFLTKKQTTSPSYSLLSSFRSTYSSQSDLAGSNFVEQVDIQNAQPTSGISIDRSGLYNPPEHSHEPASKSKLIKLIKAYAYGESWYWEDRYSNQSGSFDWYQKYPSLAPLINLYIPRHHQILVTGCGNSAFSEGMVNDGYDDVVNIDISSVVIEAMQKKYANTPQLKYNQMDVRDMSAFQKGSFDAVIDKGTLDSLLCGFNSEQNAVKMLKEVWR
ncbi:uncharacterized protein [Euphorbia lathyris]|uniref:uncharacterized protein isoform X2 n=1 Tax=Euphorbia lathyris TaxID=212925 RepID=UPI003313D52B